LGVAEIMIRKARMKEIRILVGRVKEKDREGIESGMERLRS